MTPELEALLREADATQPLTGYVTASYTLVHGLARELRAALADTKRAQHVIEAARVCVAAHIDTHDGRLERAISDYDAQERKPE